MSVANFLIAFIILILSALAIYILRHEMREHFLEAAQEKAKIILDRNMATHAFYSKKLKPAIFKLTDKYRSADYFDPVWMSSTYAIREIDHEFQIINDSQYYYKESAINARSPHNEADEFEKEFITKINHDPSINHLSQIRNIDGKDFFVTLRRGEMMEKSCLRCHTTPDLVPAGLIDAYGPERSFKRHEGEVVSAISIRIPLTEAFHYADTVSLKLSALIVGLLLIIFVAQYFIYNHLIAQPIKHIRAHAQAIANDELKIGETIAEPRAKELAEFTQAFNLMSKKLKDNFDGLETKVKERTSELEHSMAEIKTLKGIIPICASCKKIRDDQGYWNQLEKFISQNSHAQFSHGICPDCYAKAIKKI